MSEYETDPQRPSANADATPSYPTAELSPVERGPADSTTASTGPVAAGAEPATATGGQPDQAAPTGAQAAPTEQQPPTAETAEPTEQQPTLYAEPTTGAPTGPTDQNGSPYAGQPGTSSTPAGPYAGYPRQTDPYAAPQGGGQPGPVAPAGTYPPSPWHPAAQNQPGGWTGNPSYAGQHAPGSHLPPPHLRRRRTSAGTRRRSGPRDRVRPAPRPGRAGWASSRRSVPPRWY